jgi:mono/diheme cytochrome c family protein
VASRGRFPGSTFALAVGLAWFGLTASTVAAQSLTAGRPGANANTVEQGRYLVTAGDCISCHTVRGAAPFSGGRALSSPFGTIYSANITPDAETGIGRWSEHQFSRALRQGIAADGTHLYPAFPYPSYTLVTDADIHAMYEYLRTVRPVRYPPPKSALTFPFGIRGLLAGWNAMFLQAGPYAPDAARSAEWNRGAYLTLGLGHCGACHTPRNALGGERSSQALTGGVLLEAINDEVLDDKITPLDEPIVRQWSAANLTPATRGLGAWSLEQIADYLKTGHNARAGAFGPMDEVVTNSTSHLTDADLHAIAVYLKSLPATAQPPVAEASRSQLKVGETVYETRCGDCHLATGLGMPRKEAADASKTAPPLAGNAALQAPDPATLINVVLYGAHEASPGGPAWPKMSGFELSVGLDDEQIAALCTYVRSSWGNRAGPVDASAVAKQH